jgi:hypothetical protein
MYVDPASCDDSASWSANLEGKTFEDLNEPPSQPSNPEIKITKMDDSQPDQSGSFSKA